MEATTSAGPSSAVSAPKVQAPEPTVAEDSTFASDPRVHFDQRSGKWAFEADDGSEMEWDLGRGVWVPVLDEETVLKQQAAYSVEGVDENAPVAAVLAREAKKRSAEDGTAATNKKSKRPPRVQKQTSIFISHLPPSATVSQISSAFKVAGLILEDPNGDPRIKLYKKEDGTPKGEALVIYLKEESVELAIRLLDETELVPGAGEGEMKVAKAEWEKKEKKVEVIKEGSKAEGEKKKAGRRVEKQQKKLADWSSDDEDAATIAARAKYSRIVVLKGMFTLKELEEDATLLLDLKEEVRDECESMGEVTNVTLYDREEDGIMTIRFKEDAPAQACIAKLNNRYFAGRTISATLFDGTKKYRKNNSSGATSVLEGTGLGGDNSAEVEEKEKERLEKYAEWLEKDEKTG